LLPREFDTLVNQSLGRFCVAAAFSHGWRLPDAILYRATFDRSKSAHFCLWDARSLLSTADRQSTVLILDLLALDGQLAWPWGDECESQL
jgi:hypothetical protein